jgi:lipid-A-disaccharide synthase
VQTHCNGPELTHELALRLDDADLRQRQVAAQYEALDEMGRGGPDPAEAAADALLKILKSRPRSTA